MTFIDRFISRQKAESRTAPQPKKGRLQRLFSDFHRFPLETREALALLSYWTHEQVPPINNQEYPPEEVRRSIERHIETCLSLGVTPEMITRIIDPEHTLYPDRWDLPIIREVLQSFPSKEHR